MQRALRYGRVRPVIKNLEDGETWLREYNRAEAEATMGHVDFHIGSAKNRLTEVNEWLIANGPDAKWR